MIYGHGEDIISNKQFRNPNALLEVQNMLFTYIVHFSDCIPFCFKLNATVHIDRRFVDKVGV